MYIYIYIYMCIYKYIYICTFAYIYMYTYIQPIAFGGFRGINIYICVFTYIYICIYIYSLLHLECHVFNFEPPSMIFFIKSLLPRSVKKRPMRLILDIQIESHSQCNRLNIHIQIYIYKHMYLNIHIQTYVYVHA